MGTNRFDVDGIQVEVPEYYQEVDTMPDDPPGAVDLAAQTNLGAAIVLLYTISAGDAMPCDDVRKIVDMVHRSLADNQGLVQVDGGTTAQGSGYVYTIVKTAVGESSVQYTLSADFHCGAQALHVQGYFEEGPTTGIRASAMHAALSAKGIVGPKLANWARDPYDAERTAGFLANRGEDEEYDRLFPEHPLSLARELVRCIAQEM